ncbi:hypothetical protein [Endozoicomonas atrinae]|uniref:hypothetical protein n=1 Tax=Endozoicomonas atrinae TaxID=1333660 RepID=UPI003AFFD34B
MEKAWAIIIDDDQAACMMAIPRLFEQLPLRLPAIRKLVVLEISFFILIISLLYHSVSVYIPNMKGL